MALYSGTLKPCVSILDAKRYLLRLDASNVAFWRVRQILFHSASGNMEGLLTVSVVLWPTCSFIVDIRGLVLSSGGFWAVLFLIFSILAPSLQTQSFAQLIRASYNLTTAFAIQLLSPLAKHYPFFLKPPFINWLTNCRPCKKGCAIVCLSFSLFFFPYFSCTTQKIAWQCFFSPCVKHS